MTAHVFSPEEHIITEEPYYEQIGSEVELFLAA